jgi:transcriptional regulator with XRE-family HTH domain
MEQSSGKPGEPSGLSFARRLRRARMARKWGPLGLAERMYKVGLDYGGSATVTSLKGMISKWERGEKSVGQDNLHLLAETLGIPVEDLGVWVDPDFVWRKATAEDAAPPSANPADDIESDDDDLHA